MSDVAELVMNLSALPANTQSTSQKRVILVRDSEMESKRRPKHEELEGIIFHLLATTQNLNTEVSSCPTIIITSNYLLFRKIVVLNFM